VSATRTAPTAELLEDWDRRYYLHEHVTPAEYRFVHVVAADGMEFTLGDGTRMLDFASQTACCNLGHRHPRVVGAIKEALDRYGHLTAYPRLGNHYKPKLAKLLVDDVLGDDGWAGRVRFLSSGSEAVDQAMLIARLYTQRPIIVAFQHAFHGSTLGAGGIGTHFRGYAGGLSSPTDPNFLRTVPGYPAAGSAVVPAANCFRCPVGHTYPACKSVQPAGPVPCLHAAEQLIRNLGPENVAALIAEPMSVTGVPNPPEYVRQIRELTSRLGILWIDDEIITGFGRTGSWFAYQWSGVVPDIMTIGKAFTNATIPMSATIVSEEIGDFFSQYRWMVGGTHAGNPIAAAAAIAAIEAYRDEGLIERGSSLGEYLGPLLDELAGRHPCVGCVTGRGAFWSLELTKDAATREPFVPEGRDLVFGGDLSKLPGAVVAAEAWRCGVFLRHDGPETVQLAPPLIATRSHCDTALEALDAGLDALEATLGA
jgi:taurine---2-oxoglutarate transaminase